MRCQVLVARTAPDADESCAQLKALGYAPIKAVTAEIVFHSTPLDLTEFDAIALTSRNAARALAQATDRRDLKVFTVGDATARQAQSLGFETVFSAAGDVSALADLIHTTRPLSAILHVRGRDQAGDLVCALDALGIKAKSQIIYTAQPVDRLAPASKKALESQIPVLIYSAKGAERLIDLAQTNALLPHLIHAPIIGMSSAAVQPLSDAGASDITLARTPDQNALYAALASRVQTSQ